MQVGQTEGGRERIEKAIRTGSSASGVSFDYLARTAYRESSNRTDLTSNTSSATGLFQFLDQTWLGLVKEEGPGVGLSTAANAITRNASTGRYDVADPGVRQRILDLRKDPTVSAVMAGRFTAKNQALLTQSLGRQPSQGELYAAHVLGPSGGARLIQMVQNNPDQPAADYFRDAAGSNRAIFYNPDGGVRSAGQVLNVLTRQHDAAQPTPTADRQAMPILPPVPDRSAQVTQLANVIQAQSASYAAKDPTLFDPAASAADQLKTVRTTIAAMSMPGEVKGKATESGGRQDGWRARRTSDAFSALMRSDAADLEGAAGPMDLAALASGGAAAQAAASKMLPGLGGMAGASAFAPLSSRTPAARAAETLAGDGGRPSRILTGARDGNPAMPLPMVTDAMGVARPSRFSAAAYVAAVPDAPARATSGIIPVRTSAIIVGDGGAQAQAAAVQQVQPGRGVALAPPLDLAAAARGRR